MLKLPRELVLRPCEAAAAAAAAAAEEEAKPRRKDKDEELLPGQKKSKQGVHVEFVPVAAPRRFEDGRDTSKYCSPRHRHAF